MRMNKRHRVGFLLLGVFIGLVMLLGLITIVDLLIL
jgi:hypothetical protein